MERIKITDHGVTVSAVTRQDLEECGTTHKDIGKIIDYLNAVREGRFCVLLVDDKEKGIVKGSTRTQDAEIDVSKICSVLGGGDHKKAAGFGIPGRLVNDVVIRILKQS